MGSCRVLETGPLLRNGAPVCSKDYLLTTLLEFTVSLHFAPVSRMMAEVRCGWAPGWTEIRSRSYGLKEAQVQMQLNQPGPG